MALILWLISPPSFPFFLQTPSLCLVSALVSLSHHHFPASGSVRSWLAKGPHRLTKTAGGMQKATKMRGEGDEEEEGGKHRCTFHICAQKDGFEKS